MGRALPVRPDADPAEAVRIGYTRVSTVAQTLDQQNEALSAAGVVKVFSDTMSGARDDRPGLAALLEYASGSRSPHGGYGASLSLNPWMGDFAWSSTRLP